MAKIKEPPSVKHLSAKARDSTNSSGTGGRVEKAVTRKIVVNLNDALSGRTNDIIIPKDTGFIAATRELTEGEGDACSVTSTDANTSHVGHPRKHRRKASVPTPRNCDDLSGAQTALGYEERARQPSSGRCHVSANSPRNGLVKSRARKGKHNGIFVKGRDNGPSSPLSSWHQDSAGVEILELMPNGNGSPIGTLINGDACITCSIDESSSPLAGVPNGSVRLAYGRPVPEELSAPPPPGGGGGATNTSTTEPTTANHKESFLPKLKVQDTNGSVCNRDTGDKTAGSQGTPRSNSKDGATPPGKSEGGTLLPPLVQQQRPPSKTGGSHHRTRPKKKEKAAEKKAAEEAAAEKERKRLEDEAEEARKAQPPITEEDLLRPVPQFTRPPVGRPLTLCFFYANNYLTHRYVLDQIKNQIHSVPYGYVTSLQFIDRNVTLATKGMLNRWVVTLSCPEARDQLLRMGIKLFNKKIYLRRYDDVSDEDYKEFSVWTRQVRRFQGLSEEVNPNNSDESDDSSDSDDDAPSGGHGKHHGGHKKGNKGR